MASKLVFLGNITAISLTLLSFLQIIPWSLIGLMILATLILPMLFSGRSNRNIQAKAAPPKQNPSRHELIRIETIPSQESSLIRPAVKPGVGGPLPENSAIISKGDYEKYEVDLKEGNEFVSEVKATGLINVYLLDRDNLTSLDMGEEFWHEAGEESVQDATIHFTASSSGKWFLVVENADFKEVTATVNNRVA